MHYWVVQEEVLVSGSVGTEGSLEGTRGSVETRILSLFFHFFPSCRTYSLADFFHSWWGKMIFGSSRPTLSLIMLDFRRT